MEVKVHKVVDAKGLACPMPIVKTKKASEQMNPGEVLEVLATDQGSLADLKGWANSVGHQYLGMKQEGDVFRHYIRKADPREERKETTYPRVIDNETLREKLQSGQRLTIIDTREEAEYAFGHIPGSVSIPLGALEKEIERFSIDEEIYVICRTGQRSDQACGKLASLGYKNVTNVLPGMSGWKGPIEKGISERSE